MADKFTKQVEKATSGMAPDAWFNSWFLGKIQSIENDTSPLVKALKLDGTEIIIPSNRAMLVFDKCTLQRQGTSQNHGEGGSNSVTGVPKFICDVTSCYMVMFNDKKEGIFNKCEGNVYASPLVFLSKNPNLEVFVKELHAEFVALRKGGNTLEMEHVGNGLASQIASTVFHLANEISLTDKSVLNKERMTFLVEALYILVAVARDVATFDETVKKIFTILPYTSQIADILQGILMSYIFNEIPCVRIRYNWIGLTLKRYFRYNGKDASMITSPATGQIACFLVAPMLAQLVTTDLSNEDIAKKIVTSIDQAIDNIVVELKKKDQLTTDQKNVLILKGFLKSSPNPLIEPEKIGFVYDIVKSGKSVEECYNDLNIASKVPFFVSESTRQLSLNGKAITNMPVEIKSDFDDLQSTKSENQKVATYIPSDPREWTGIRLKACKKYELKFTNMGPGSFTTGTTIGKVSIANFRITSGTDLMKGECKGFSVSGKIYDPRTKQFTDMNWLDLQKIVPTDPFEISCTKSGINVFQKGTMVFMIPVPNTMTYQQMCPVIAFKFCSVQISMTGELDLSNDPQVQTIDPKLRVQSTNQNQKQAWNQKDSTIRSAWNK